MSNTEGISRLKKILIEESPILFLGAGFSLSGQTRDNQNIPTGNQLKSILVKELLKINEQDADFEEISSYSLAQVCQTYTHSYSHEGLHDFLTYFFSETKPAEFHYLLTKYFWKKIYTTNIDDLVENIYSKNSCELIPQQSKRKNLYHKERATHYFKLHGSVRNPSEGFTFSTDEYINSMITTTDFRFSSLSTDMHSEHFIFVGSNFDDFNIDYYLKIYENTGFASSRGKLFFINPKPSLLLKKKIEKIQGVLIEWSTQEFLVFLDDVVKESTKNKAFSVSKELESLSFNSLSVIKNKILDLEKYQSKLYLGFEPKWEDILADWDFIDRDLKMDFEEFIGRIPTNKTGIYSLVGKAYVGKSTFLKRLGIILKDNGYEVYNYNGRFFNFYPFYQYIKKSDYDKFALIVDNAGYNYGPIKQLLGMVPKDKKVVVLTASRPFYHLKYRYNLIGCYFHEYEFSNQISISYAESILDKITEKGYLGELAKIDSTEHRIMTIKRNNDVMSTLFSITYGTGFIQRLTKDLQPLLFENSDTKDILISLAIFNKVELIDFPVELLNQMTNNRNNEFLAKIENFVKFTSNRSIQLRSTFFVSNILSSTDKTRILSQIKRILIIISSQIDDINHTYWNEILAGLIREKSLRKILNFTSKEIQHLLYGIRNYYYDNFNYWIQLGISEQREKEFEKALNHFKVAESLRKNSYMVQNAIGRNFLKQANSIDNVEVSKKYFEQGETILKKLIEEREEYQARAFSTHCLLYEKITFLTKFNLHVSNEEIEKMYSYLNKILQKDSKDVMARHISNIFYKFLKVRGKTSIIRISFNEISQLKDYFSDYNLNVDNLMEEFEIE